jgi:hypothetical protein
VNDGLGSDEDWVVSLQQLSANWADAACADGYEYAIGTTEGATDLVGWTSAGTATHVTRSNLTLQDGHAYYFSARAVTGADRGTPCSSDGITVDCNVPFSSVDPLPAEVNTLVFTVSWTGGDATSGVKWYDVQAKDGEGDWTNWVEQTTLNSSDFTGVDGHIYYFRSRALDNAGNSEAYPPSADTYTTVNLAGKPQVAWVHDGLTADVDWTNSATSLSASWAPASGGDGYEYAVGAAPADSDVVAWTAVGTQTNVTSSGLACLEGQTYYFSVRVVVGVTHGNAVSSDGIRVDLTPPSSAVDPLSPVSTVENFHVSWSGTDALSGIAGYNIQYKDGDGDWGDWFGWTSQTSADFPGEDGHTYYFRSRAGDLVGNVEAFPVVPDAQTTLALPPIPDIAWVNDGLGADEDWTDAQTEDSNGLSANWAAAAGVDGYQYAIGTAPGDTSFYPWGMGSVLADTFWTEREPWFKEDTTYYFSVRAVIGSRHGNPTCSDGVRVDLTPPESSVDALPEETNTLTFTVSWSGTDALSGVKHYTIRVSENSVTYVDWLVATDLTSADFTGEDGHAYYFQCGATDSAGNQEAYGAGPDAHTTTKCAYIYVRNWGAPGIGDGEFDMPTSVEVDAQGNVWVVDMDNDRVQKFSPDGAYLLQLGSEGGDDGEFARPNDVAFDDSGYIYVADTFNNRIQKFTATLTFVKKWGSMGPADGQVKYPYSLDVDDSGYVYVADTGNERVQKFTSKGVFIKAWGDSGSGEGQFRDCRGIAVDGSGMVYVSDAGNATIQKFTSDGTRLAGWGCPGSADGCLNTPYRLGLDDAGFLYVADCLNHRIQKFTADGAFVAKFGGFGEQEGKLDYPSGVALGDSGCVYTTEHVLNRVQKFWWSCP